MTVMCPDGGVAPERKRRRGSLGQMGSWGLTELSVNCLWHRWKEMPTGGWMRGLDFRDVSAEIDPWALEYRRGSGAWTDPPGPYTKVKAVPGLSFGSHPTSCPSSLHYVCCILLRQPHWCEECQEAWWRGLGLLGSHGWWRP